MVNNGINVLSVFDGICAGRLALERDGIEINNYYASEIDKFANKVTDFRYPQNIQLGDLTKWREWDIDWSSIDLFIGGSSCQGFSVAGKQGATKAVLNGEEILVKDRETYLYMKSMNAEFKSQSHLFWEYVLIYDFIKLHNPNIKFMLENVRMKKELLDMISKALGVKDMVINSSLLSAQNRIRHYWFNWKVDQPQDKGILLKDILEDIELEGLEGSEKELSLLEVVDGELRVKQSTKKGYIIAEDGDGVNLSVPTSKTRRGRVIKQKSPTLETSCNVGVVLESKYRKLTPKECARLQTFPDGWSEEIVSKSQAYKQYGNSWTVDVIAHILSGVKDELSKNVKRRLSRIT